MLVDVVHISKKIYSEVFDKNLKIRNPIKLYDSYRNLEQVIKSSNLVANHYLALNFEEKFLQDSSIGNATDKWKYFFNKDLAQLNESLKQYLLSLYEVTVFNDKDLLEEVALLEKYFNSKSFYNLVNREYSCGHVSSENLILCMNVLVTQYDNQSYNILNQKDIDLSTYEKRKDLKIHLHTQIEEFENLRSQLKQYIQKNFTITDLL